MRTLGEEYCLIKGRSDFRITPDIDGKLLFGKTTSIEETRRVTEDQILRECPPKSVLYGNYGTGKTHTLYHIKYHLEKTFPGKLYTVYLKLPALQKNGNFQVLHERILETLTQAKIQELVIQFQQRYSGPNLKTELIDFFNKNVDFAEAILRMGLSGPACTDAWRWMMGESLDQNGLKNIGVTRNLNQPSDYVSVLRNIGKLFKEGPTKKEDQKTILLLIDECESLGKIKDVNAEGHWEYALRELADPSNHDIGFILTLTADVGTHKNLPQVGKNAIYTRIVEDELGIYQILSDIGEQKDVRQFMDDLLEVLVDHKCAKTKIDKQKLPIKNIETFPFTEDSLKTFTKWFLESPQRRRPRFIISMLNKLGMYALRKEKPYFDDVTTLEILDILS